MDTNTDHFTSLVLRVRSKKPIVRELKLKIKDKFYFGLTKLEKLYDEQTLKFQWSSLLMLAFVLSIMTDVIMSLSLTFFVLLMRIHNPQLKS